MLGFQKNIYTEHMKIYFFSKSNKNLNNKNHMLLLIIYFINSIIYL